MFRIWSVLLAGVVTVAGAVVGAGAAEQGLSVVQPEQFVVVPDAEAELSWRGVGAESCTYEVRDYRGALVGQGTALPDAAQAGVVRTALRLPRGYYEIVFPELGGRFGLLALEPAAGAPDPYFGVDADFNWLERRPAVRRALVPAVRRLGVALSRERINWAGINPKPGVWNWQQGDRTAELRELYAQHGMKVLEVFHHAGPAAGPDTRPFPENLLVTAQAWPEIYQKLRGSWGGLEAWNEPEASGLPADQYAPLVKTLRYAFQQNRIDAPLGGGVLMGWEPGAYHRFLALNGVLDHVDFVSFHDYRPALATEGIVRAYRDWLDASGQPGMPLWLSECGYPWTIGPGRPPQSEDEASAREIVMKGVEAKACGIACYMPFSLLFYEEGGAKSFSMIGRELTPLRSLAAYAQNIRALAGRVYVGDLATGIPHVARARVFGPAPESAATTGGAGAKARYVVVLYTAKSGAPLQVRPPFLVTAAEGIDGRRLQQAGDAGFDATDGLLYLYTDDLAGQLKTDTPAADLLRRSRATQTARTQAGPVVLQHIRGAGYESRTAHRYLLSNRVASDLPVRIRATNLGDAPQELRLVWDLEGESPLENGAGRERVLTLPGRSSAEASWRIDAAARLDLAQVRALTIRGTLVGGEPAAPASPAALAAPVAPVALALLCEGSLQQHMQRYSRQMRLPLEQLGRWSANIAPLGTMRMQEGEGGGSCLRVAWSRPGDRWCYPQFALERQQLLGWGGLLLRARVQKQAGVKLMLLRGKTAAYWTSSPVIAADNEWHAVYVPFADFDPLTGGNFDANTGRRDLESITAISVGLSDAKENAENALEVSDLILVGP